MKTESIKKKKSILALVFTLIIVLNTFINYIWLKIDTFPLWFDYGQYFTRSINFYHLTLGLPLSFQRAVLGTGMSYKPLLHRVLLPIVAVPFYYIFDVSADIAVMSCVVFLTAALSATYGIASKIFGRRTGILAAFILSVSPGFFTLSRRFSPEFAVIGLVALTIYFLIRSDNFHNRIYSILFGFSFGLCMITKESAFAFIPGALIYVIYKHIVLYRSQNNFRPPKILLINLFLSFLAFAIVAVPIYWTYRERAFLRILDIAYSQKVRESYNMVEPYSLAGLTFYFRYLFNYAFGRIFVICSVFGSILALRNKITYKGFIFWWLIGAYILLCTTITRFSEYALPLLVPLAILSAYGVNQLFKSKFKKRLFIIFIIVWGCARFLLISFPIQAGLSSRPYYQNLILPENFRQSYPKTEDWKAEELIDYISNNKNNKKAISSIHIGANLRPFSPTVLEYVSVLKRENFVFYGYNAGINSILACDFVVVKSGQNQGISYTPEDVEELISKLEASGNFVILPRKFLLPDGSEAVVYKRKTD